ncbi:FHA domain-containing protein [Alistipes sp.]|uniref:FHA domain-containing protein n=1 Tax=Alistipes sp. TaxID=1872444 RepID=UPI003A844C23
MNQPGMPNANYGGTHFPGMNTGPQASANSMTETHKPIMGFLYSVSRTACGEYWPLYMGLNTIGRATTCSVRLAEATISDNHAEIVIRQMKNPDSVLVSIRDSRSTCGTLLNGSSLGFDAQECHNGDIITFGEHYEFYFILIDTKALGLEPRQDFIPAGNMPMQPGMGGMPPMFGFQQPMGGATMPGMGGAMNGGGFGYPSQQYPMGGGNAYPAEPSAPSGGGTKIMPAMKK